MSREARVGVDQSASGIGDSVERTEDPAFITGQATYTDDIEAPRALHAAVLGSQYGHAQLNDIDTAGAEAVDEVEAVFTAESMAAEGRTPPPRKIPSISTDYIQVSPDLFRPVIAKDRVRYQGEPIAIVLATDRYTAYDALEEIHVEYDRLDAVTDAEAATEPDAPSLHEDYPDNVAYDWEHGDAEAVEAAFDAADHTVRTRLAEQRIIPDPLEPRAALAEYDAGSDQLTVRMSTQTPHSDRHALAGILQHPENKIHVAAPRVGGGFGAKIHNYDVEALVPWCARELERPVTWQARRSSIHQTSSQGRGMEFEAELAVDDDGTIQAVRAEGLVGIGGYVSSHIHMLTTVFCVELLPGQYDVPALHARIQGVLTNETPLDSFRGVHEVPAITVIERLMDEAAAQLHIDPATLRERNQIEPDAFPYESVTGVTYDSGDYQRALEQALEHVDYDALRQRQAALREEGRYLGIGIGCYAHVTGVGPADVCKEAGIFKTHWESGRITVHQSGTVTAYCGTMDFGMGHDTIYAQIVAEKLGVPIDDIEIIEGDTRQLNDGVGTHASRSAVVGGSALVESAERVIEKGREVAAHQLEAAEADVEFADGEFFVAGAPDRSMSIQDVGEQAHRAWDVPGEPGLEATTYWLPEELCITAGAHVAVVEVDPSTGDVSFEGYVAVDDCGERINPMIVEGQLHGGIAQGIGQALYEDAAYDADGNMVTSMLQDYAMPKAVDIPEMTVDGISSPAPSNPLGAKGIGETGPIAATPATVNAVIDALRPFGVGRDVELPLSSHRIWEFIDEADASPAS